MPKLSWLFMLLVINLPAEAKNTSTAQKDQQTCLSEVYQPDTRIAACSRALQVFAQDSSL
jgi:hypothetical protein